jgi:hypothetical protein
MSLFRKCAECTHLENASTGAGNGDGTEKSRHGAWAGKGRLKRASLGEKEALNDIDDFIIVKYNSTSC